ncbi:MAG TPA: EamA family transporter [Bryobacteraceae bacterium]|nr:EamA family transporter [Bryobacteraceae bacterium]
MRHHPGITAYLALAAVCLFWGTTYLAIRMGLESFPPFVLVAVRFLLSGSILLAAARARGAWLPRGREFWQAAFTGVLILSIGNGCLTVAELYIPSGLAGLIYTLLPFWMVGIEAMMPRGERLHAPTILGMVVGFSGVALLFSGGTALGSFHLAALGGLVVLHLGMASWAFGSLYQRRHQTRSHPIVVAAVQQVSAGISVIPLALFTGSRTIAWSTRGVGALFYLVIFGSLVGYSAYVVALDRLPVAVVSIYPYMNAVVAVALGWLFYREPFGMREAVAMLVIFTGVALVKWQSGKAAPAKMQAEA